MARRTPGSDTAESKDPLDLSPVSEEQQSKAATTGIPGGSPGIILEARATVSVPGAAEPGKAAPPSSVNVEVERCRVAAGGPHPDGTWPILYDGVRVFLRPGKEVNSTTYDLGYLRAQGVKLEPIA
jgi:hypothetical protein